MQKIILRAAAATTLTSGQRLTRAGLVLLALAVIGTALSAEHATPDGRVAALGFALLFLHTASNSPALADPRLSFRKSSMARLPLVLLALSETILTLAAGHIILDKLFAWLA